MPNPGVGGFKPSLPKPPKLRKPALRVQNKVRPVQKVSTPLMSNSKFRFK